VTRVLFATGRADLDVAVLPRVHDAPRPRTLLVKASGLATPRLGLRINGLDFGSHDRADLERGIPVEVT
jgi:hypothetical protein